MEVTSPCGSCLSVYHAKEKLQRNSSLWTFTFLHSRNHIFNSLYYSVHKNLQMSLLGEIFMSHRHRFFEMSNALHIQGSVSACPWNWDSGHAMPCHHFPWMARTILPLPSEMRISLDSKTVEYHKKFLYFSKSLHCSKRYRGGKIPLFHFHGIHGLPKQTCGQEFSCQVPHNISGFLGEKIRPTRFYYYQFKQMLFCSGNIITFSPF